MSLAEMDQLGSLLIDGAAHVVAEEGITIINGGTQAGIMQMMGEGHAAVGGSTPLVGVLPSSSGVLARRSGQ